MLLHLIINTLQSAVFETPDSGARFMREGQAGAGAEEAMGVGARAIAGKTVGQLTAALCWASLVSGGVGGC